MLGPLLMCSAKMGSLLLKIRRKFGLSPEKNMTIINDLEKRTSEERSKKLRTFQRSIFKILKWAINH